ncbi:hypothetical protein KJ359_008216 [Pestalotiopsis sp. 9143b]|nr:hypothetical protein KJ359_008216 [Pestalotiopsis sp. 9143b]
MFLIIAVFYQVYKLNCKSRDAILDITQKCIEHVFQHVEQVQYHSGRELYDFHGQGCQQYFKYFKLKDDDYKPSYNVRIAVTNFGKDQ